MKQYSRSSPIGISGTSVGLQGVLAQPSLSLPLVPLGFLLALFSCFSVLCFLGISSCFLGLDATPYFSALCDGECLEGEFHTSNRILMGTFPYMHVFFGLLEAYHCKNKLTTSIEMCNFPLHV